MEQDMSRQTGSCLLPPPLPDVGNSRLKDSCHLVCLRQEQSVVPAMESLSSTLRRESHHVNGITVRPEEKNVEPLSRPATILAPGCKTHRHGIKIGHHRLSVPRLSPYLLEMPGPSDFDSLAV